MKNNNNKLHKTITFILIALITCLVIFSTGCTTAPATTEAPPLPDLDAVRTESAKTVVAEITVQAALNPSPVPSDEPEAPTDIPVIAPTAMADQASLVQENTATTQPTITSAPTTKPPSNNSSSAEQTIPAYRCNLLRQAPANGYETTPGANFDVTWAVRNTGTATWESQTFDFIYLKGDEFHKFADGEDLNDIISTDETHDFFLNMVAPSTPGFYQTWWSLVDGHQTPVCILYLSINVVE